MTHLAVLNFDDPKGAERALLDIYDDKATSSLGNALQLLDAAVVVKTQGRRGNERVKITQTAEAVAKGAKTLRGSWWGLLIGLLFGGPIGGALLGGAIGRIAGRKLDLGIDNEFITKVGEDLQIGGSALLVLTDRSPDEAMAAAAAELKAGIAFTAIANDAADVLAEVASDTEIADAIEADQIDEG